MIDPASLHQRLTTGHPDGAAAVAVATTRSAVQASEAQLDAVRAALPGGGSVRGRLERHSAALTAADAELEVAATLLRELTHHQLRVRTEADRLLAIWLLATRAGSTALAGSVLGAQVSLELARLLTAHEAELTRLASAFDALAGGAAQAAAPWRRGVGGTGPAA